MVATGRRVALAGATGLVGQSLLDGLLADGTVKYVHALVRRPLSKTHPKLIAEVVDFAALPVLPPLDELYLTLGTTIKVAGSQAAFRAVDFDANLAVARAAQAAGATRAGLVSAMGADAKSRVFYCRVKGELEEALAQLAFEGLVIVRPSLLTGDRVALGQRDRPGERLGVVATRLLGQLIPSNYRPIAAEWVARSLLTRVPMASGCDIVLSGSLQPSALDC